MTVDRTVSRCLQAACPPRSLETFPGSSVGSTLTAVCVWGRGALQRPRGHREDYVQGDTLGNELTGGSSDKKQMGPKCGCRHRCWARQVPQVVGASLVRPGSSLHSPAPLSLQFSKDVLRHAGMWQPEAKHRSQWFLVALEGPGFVSRSKQM